MGSLRTQWLSEKERERESLTSWSVSFLDPVPAGLTGPSKGNGTGGLATPPLS